MVGKAGRFCLALVGPLRLSNRTTRPRVHAWLDGRHSLDHPPERQASVRSLCEHVIQRRDVEVQVQHRARTTRPTGSPVTGASRTPAPICAHSTRTASPGRRRLLGASGSCLGGADGNTLACRTYHLGSAGDDAATHSPHAGEDGGGICVNGTAARVRLGDLVGFDRMMLRVDAAGRPPETLAGSAASSSTTCTPLRGTALANGFGGENGVGVPVLDDHAPWKGPAIVPMPLDHREQHMEPTHWSRDTAAIQAVRATDRQKVS